MTLWDASSGGGCTQTYMRASEHLSTQACSVHACISVCVCMCVCVCLCVYVYMSVCLVVCLSFCLYASVCVCVYISVCIYVCVSVASGVKRSESSGVEWSEFSIESGVRSHPPKALRARVEALRPARLGPPIRARALRRMDRCSRWSD